MFCKIIAGALPATRVDETGTTVAFRDIAPNAPVDVLVVPRAHHRDLAALTAADPRLAADLLATAVRVADKEGLADGYRVVFNAGPHAGQVVFHVHAHVLGGGELGQMATA